MTQRLNERSTDHAIELSSDERRLLIEALTMMMQELNQVAQWIEDANRAATLNSQPLDHAPEKVDYLVASAGRAYDLRERLEHAID